MVRNLASIFDIIRLWASPYKNYGRGGQHVWVNF